MKHLEPVVKKNSSFSILFLRDDSSVVRFRLKPVWLKFFVILFIAFSASSGAAGYAAHYYWKKYNTLQRERIELAEKLGENRRQLGRFEGIESIKEAKLPRSTMAPVNSNGNGNTNGGTMPAETSQSQAPDAEKGNQSASESGGSAVPPASQPAATPDIPATMAASGPESPAAIPENRANPAGVDDVQLQLQGSNSYRLSFGLSNKDQQITLNGRIHLAVSDKNGKRHSISQVNRDSLRFVINRFKNVVTVFTLPPDVPATDVVRLFITVTAENVPNATFSFTVPAS